ncbi:MAG: flagellin lysine-N-methylase [Clostridia bacterium]|nr:flagellin lysine-N-methylase [Clostridia bacterium]
MKESHTFLVPDYFSHFSCKMGDCRHACCVGWPVSISMDNYFHLLGVDCTPDLRRRLDCAMYPLESPTPEAYARINHRYDGECAARLPDGRCAIQAELGEDYLADVCRLYPRGVRVEDGGAAVRCECSCAGSCEAVLEMLLRHPEPIAFVEYPMTLHMPHIPEREVQFETLGRAQAIRLFLIRTMQNRALSLPARLAHLGQTLYMIDWVLHTRDGAALDAILAGSVALPALPEGKLTQSQLADGLRIAEAMIAAFDAQSDSIREQGEAALAYFGKGEAALARYHAANDAFAARFPDWAIWFEHMLVNHMFFAQFPFQDRPESIGDELVGLCAVYALLRFLALGTQPADEAALVDIAAACFRLIEHTDFDRTATHMLKRIGCTRPEQLWDLISL